MNLTLITGKFRVLLTSRTRVDNKHDSGHSSFCDEHKKLKIKISWKI